MVKYPLSLTPASLQFPAASVVSEVEALVVLSVLEVRNLASEDLPDQVQEPLAKLWGHRGKISEQFPVTLSLLLMMER